MTTGDRGRHNNFDVLRLLAAVAVLVSHSFVLSGRVEPSIGNDSIGAIAVLVFFAISGFLITQSWLREPRILNYAGRRALRIMPALIGVLLISTFVLGPAVTTLSLGSYLHDHETWSYFLKNSVFQTVFQLPGVFDHIPNPDVVNGSLWTLPAEVHAYAMIAVLGLIGALRSRRIAIAMLIVVCLVSVAAPHLTERVTGNSGDPFLLRTFVLGALIFICREIVVWRWWLAAALLAAWVATVLLVDADSGQWLGIVAVAYATIYLAFHSPASLQGLTRHGDVSYGIYLFAYPVQQTIAELWGRGITPLEMIAIALPVTYALAMGSWLLIEQPALKFKSRLRRKSSATTGQPPDTEVALNTGGSS